MMRCPTPRSNNKRLLTSCVLVSLLAYTFSACSPPAEKAVLTPSPTAAAVLLPIASPSSEPTPTATPLPPATASPTLAATKETPEIPLCSPLSGYSLAQLPDLVSNPYNPPPPGSDDPHQGVDLADRLPDSGIAITGMAVKAVLPGKVILAQTERFPYGSSVWVETPLNELPASWQPLLPTAAAPISPDPALTCPEVPQPGWDSPERSLYVLYAHFQDAPLVQTGDAASCGQELGNIGQSGNALAPHLHLEVRVGPAGWQPAGLAHYTNDAGPEEMGNYCTWRVSGLFQTVDPLALLAVFP